MTHTASSPDQIKQALARRFAEQVPIAYWLRAAMLDGESPESLGLVENGLTDILRERGINPDRFTATGHGSRSAPTPTDYQTERTDAAGPLRGPGRTGREE